jgi:uncharacterized protein (TIGR03435 family)
MITRYLLSHETGVGPALANHLWQSTVFVVAVWLVALLLRRNHAQVRYGLWLAASVKFLIPFSLLIRLGGFLPKPQHVAIGSQMTMYSAIDLAGQPFSEIAMQPVTSAAHATSLAASLMDRFAVWLPLVLAALWLCGVVTVLLVWYLRWQRVSATLRRAIPVEEGREVEVLRRLESLAKARTRIALLRSQELMEPGIFGIFRPVLLWPEGLSERLEDEHIEAILAHERMHVQRYDNLTAALHMAVEAAFWFHPIVWWVEARLVEERERACDEAVVQLSGRPEAYAESLLKVCRFCVESPLTCVSSVTGSELKQRIARIMSGQGVRKLDLRRKAALALTCVLAVGVPLTAGFLRAANGQTQPAQENGNEKSGIAGTWQGKEHTPDGRDLRMVLKIAKDEKGALSATLYSIDQKDLPVTGSVRFQEGKLRFVNDFPGLTYEGTMSADGNSMSGTMTLAMRSLPLALERAKPETEWATPVPPPRIAPMAPDAKPDVEVATIKPTQPGTKLFMLTMQGGNLVVKNLTLGFLMNFAYELPERQIAGKPGWMDTDKWDIEAKPDTPGMPSLSQERVIMRKLLVERFGLQFHQEKRKLAAYVLIVGKDGPKMTKTADASLSPNFSMYPSGVLGARSATMADLAQLLQNHILGQPLVDKTGLEGRWDFTMKWTPDETQFANAPVPVPPPADDANAPPPLFTAIQEQLGLKLEPQKMDAPVLVIDHVDHPSPN